MLARRQTFVFGAEAGELGIPALGQLAPQAALKLSGFCWIGDAVRLQDAIPLGLGGGSALDRLAPLVVGLGGHFEVAVVPVEGLAGEGGLLGSEGGAVHAGGVGLVGGAEADRGGDLDHAGLVGDRLGRLDRLADPLHIVVAVGHVLHVPAVGLVALEHVLGERHRCVTVDGDVVVVVKGDQLAQT